MTERFFPLERRPSIFKNSGMFSTFSTYSENSGIFLTGVSNFDYFWKVVLVSIFGKIFGKFCKTFGPSETPVFFWSSFDRQQFLTFDF